MTSIAMVLAGFLTSDVDELRRALNYQRDPGRLERVRANLRASLEMRGVPRSSVEKIVKMTQSSALYGFPNPHAISFGLLAYASTYLKVHRAVEFTAGLLNNQPMGFYGSATLLQDARQHGLRVCLVSVQQSDWLCTVEGDDTLRLGFNQVQGLRQNSVGQLVDARARASFVSLDDFRARAGLSKDQQRALARLGALNAFCVHRRVALWQIERDPWIGDLFSPAQYESEAVAMATPLRAMNAVERVQADYCG